MNHSDAKINLSLRGVQNNMAVAFATILTTEELCDIKLNEIQCPADLKATTPCGGMNLTKELSNGKSIILECVININTVPVSHYLLTTIRHGKMDQLVYKCSPHISNPIFLAKIIAKAINFSKHKDSHDATYSRKNIIKNFSKSVIKNCKCDTYGLTRMKELLIEMQQSIEGSRIIDKETKEWEFKSIKFAMEYYTVGIYKFSYTNLETGAEDFCYFEKNIIGLDGIILALSSAIDKIKLHISDNFGM